MADHSRSASPTGVGSKPWIKVRTDLRDDPRVCAMADRLGVGEATVIGGCVIVWSIADAHSTDGHLPGMTADTIQRKTAIPGIAQAMEAVGWLIITDDGVTIPDFGRHNGASAKSRAQAATRKQRQRGDGAVTHVSRCERDSSVTRAGQPRDTAVTPAGQARDRTGTATAPIGDADTPSDTAAGSDVPAAAADTPAEACAPGRTGASGADVTHMSRSERDTRVTPAGQSRDARVTRGEQRRLEQRPPPPPPDPPPSCRTDRAPTADWGVVVAALGDIGLADADGAAGAARERGYSPAQVRAIVAQWRTLSGVGPGAVAWRLAHVPPSRPVEDGWPPGRDQATARPAPDMDIDRYAATWSRLRPSRRSELARRAHVDLTGHEGQGLRELPAELRRPLIAALASDAGRESADSNG